MISLFTRDDYAALGLAAVLDGERIAHRRIRRLTDHDQPLLVVVGADLSPDESVAVAGQRSLVLNGGTAFAIEVLGARRAALDDSPVAVSLGESIWPADLRVLAGQFGKAALRVPRVPFCRISEPLRGERVARLLDGRDARALPAVVQVGDCLWSSLDLGTAFAHLLTERYVAGAGRRRAATLRAWARGAAETAYYAAPARLRALARMGSYGVLERRLQRLGERASEYPVDPTGWLMIELIKALIRRAAGGLARLAHWPAGHRSAAVLTHDLEPRRYAYTEGLARFLEGVGRRGDPCAFGIVARPGARYLQDAQRAALAGHSVFCHGLDHRREQVWGRERVTRTVRRARAALVAQLGRPVVGYRSPRLDRSPDLDWALDEAGFVYDSSHPDVDRENLDHYGAGVRLNLPYRPLLEDAGQWRTSRCLELPLTAPDCIQPLFAGDDAAQLRAAVEQKAAFVRASGGLYVALIHAGVFGPDDAARREAHADVVAEQLRNPATWLTTPERVVEWWTAREQLQVQCTAGDAVVVTNSGARPVAGAVLVIERDGAVEHVALSTLAPGEAISVDGGAVEAPAEWRACSLASQ